MHALMPEIGHVRVTTPAGQDFDFVPSLGAFNSLGTGAEIIATAADLYDRRPLVSVTAARCVMLACHVGTGDISSLIGYWDDGIDVAGLMPAWELLATARHLARHGLAGKSRPGGARGEYSAEFSVAHHVAAAEAHLGITKEAALAKTMTELQLLIEAKFPEAAGRRVPTREEYDRQIAAIMARRAEKEAAHV